MPTRRTAPWVRRIWALNSLIAVFLLSAVALAGGRVQWAKTTVKENDDSKSWKLELKIFMARAPDVPHVPVKFEFLPTAYYERAMLDGDKLVERRVPLENHQEIIESVEVGFMDPGTGKIEKGTKFSFKVTRALGFEAGEYKVTLRDGRNGQLIGTPATLKFEGENEVIDRRAMVFADKGKKKKDGDKADEKKDESGDKADEKKDESGDKADEKKDETTSPAEQPPDEENADEKPGEVKQKPGGCGCRLADSSNSSWSGLALLALGLAALGMRRSR
jgi:MYXO-CTERM domain-containing protein